MKMFISALTIALMASTVPALAQAAPDKDTIVLVHGAFADGSSWQKVIPLLEEAGYPVEAVQLPLTSLEDDVAATRRALARIDGPVTLVGHSWGGTVITEAGVDAKVEALVYVTAFANGVGTNFEDMVGAFPQAPGLAELVPDDQGFVKLSARGVDEFFAAGASDEEKALILATQGPIQSASFGTRVTKAAWENRPSWFVVTRKDAMIQPDAQRQMAERIHAHVVEIDSGHLPMITDPEAVASAIIEAAEAP